MADMSRSAADFYLTVEGVEYPMFLALDENGNKQMGDGLAPTIAPQVRTSGFGYDHIPPNIEIMAPFERFTGGCGFSKPRPVSDGVVHGSRFYDYSRGADLSFDDAMVVALERRAMLESDGTAIAAAPDGFFDSTLGFFMWAGAYIYEWDLATVAWIQRDDATATFSGAAYTDMAELDGVLYAARGNAADYKYSTNGTTWTAFTDADENADVFAVRGNSSDVASVWKVNDNIIKATVSGINGGTAWAGGDEVGHTSETTYRAITVDNDIYTFKREGFYRYDGVNTQDVWKTRYFDASNGKNAFLWVDGKIYSTYGRRLLQYDPYGDTSLRPIFPTPGMDSMEVIGTVAALGGDNTNLYIAVKNQAGNTYVMKGSESNNGLWAWHTIAYLGANDCDALYVTGPGVLHATNPCIVYGRATAANYTVLPTQGMSPVDDTACTFETAEGVVYVSRVDYGAAAIPKFLNRGALLGYNLSGGRYATLSYEADRSGTITTLVSATSSGLTEGNEAAEVEFGLISPVLYVRTGDASSSPRVAAFAIGATPNPARYKQWAPTVILSDALEGRDGGQSDAAFPGAAAMRRILFGAVNKRVTLTDRDRSTFTVRMLDIQPAGLKDRAVGGHEYETSSYQILMVETAATSSAEIVGIYDESDYNAGHVFGDV